MKYVPMGRREFKPVENKTSTTTDLSKVVSYDSVKQEASAFGRKVVHEELFYNKDGTLKQEVIDSMDRWYDEEAKQREDYIKNHFDNDMKIVKDALQEYGSIDTDSFVNHTWNEKEQKWEPYQVLGTKDLSMFCNIARDRAEEDLPIPRDSEFTASIVAYDGLILELVVGQGSFYFIRLDDRDPSLNFGAGI